MTAVEDLEALAGAAVDDVAVFAAALVGAPLWDYQLEIARSPARHRCIVAGRQIGKSRTLAICALHAAYSGADRRVLVVSAGENAAQDLLEHMAALTRSPLLSGSVVDESKSVITLSNGSVIESVPASERRVRGKTVDLLVLDEACLIPDDIWTAAQFTMLARPGSRVLLASSPQGRHDKFFARLWRLGMAAAPGDAMHASWHLPSTVSPMVDRELIETWRRTDPPRKFAQEVEAEWVEEAGAYFTFAELESAVDDYELVPPEAGPVRGWYGVVGCDWGFSRDASTAVVLAVDVEAGMGRADGMPVYWVPWLRAEHAMQYEDFVAEVVEIAARYAALGVASEVNGVGMAPTQLLARAVARDGRCQVRRLEPVHTTSKLKEDAFGLCKLLIQQGRLRLPRHPELLRQLGALEFETGDSGLTRISVPDSAGHDDLAMGLCLALTFVAAAEESVLPQDLLFVEDDDDMWERVQIGPDI